MEWPDHDALRKRSLDEDENLDTTPVKDGAALARIRLTRVAVRPLSAAALGRSRLLAAISPESTGVVRKNGPLQPGELHGDTRPIGHRTLPAWARTPRGVTPRRV